MLFKKKVLDKRGEGYLSVIIKSSIAIIVAGAILAGAITLSSIGITSSSKKYDEAFKNLGYERNDIYSSKLNGGLYNEKKCVVPWEDIVLRYNEAEGKGPDSPVSNIDFLYSSIFSSLSTEFYTELIFDSSITSVGKSGKVLFENLYNVAPYLNKITLGNNVEVFSGKLIDEGKNSKINTINLGIGLKEIDISVKMDTLKRVYYPSTVENYKKIKGYNAFPVTVYCTDGYYKPNGDFKDFELEYEWKCDISKDQDYSLVAYATYDETGEFCEVPDSYMLHISGDGVMANNSNEFLVEFMDNALPSIKVQGYPWANTINDNKTEEVYWDNSIIGVFIHDGLIELPSYSFVNLTNLIKLKLPNTLEKINEGMIGEFNTNIKSIVIPENVKEISINFIDGCKSLEDISVNKNNEYFSSANGILYDKNQNTLIRCPEGAIYYEGSTLKVHSNAKEIGNYAFRGCSMVEYLDINNVETIAYDAFGYFNGENIQCGVFRNHEYLYDYGDDGTPDLLYFNNKNNLTIHVQYNFVEENIFTYNGGTCINLLSNFYNTDYGLRISTGAYYTLGSLEEKVSTVINAPHPNNPSAQELWRILNEFALKGESKLSKVYFETQTDYDIMIGENNSQSKVSCYFKSIGYDALSKIELFNNCSNETPSSIKCYNCDYCNS